MKKGLMLVLIALACCALLTSCAGLKVAPAKFVHNDPAFSIEYPGEWTKGSRPESLLYAYTGAYKLPGIAVNKNAASLGTTDDAAKGLCESLKKDSEAQSCKILYAKRITLSDGTPANEVSVEWKHPAALLYSVMVGAAKNKTTVNATITHFAPIDEGLKTYLRSIKFE